MLLPVAMVAWPQLPAPSDDTLSCYSLFTSEFGSRRLCSGWTWECPVESCCYNVIPGPLLSLCIMSNSEIISSTEPCVSSSIESDSLSAQ